MYIIEKKSPATSFYIIHRGLDKEASDDFLVAMAAGGYDKSATDGTCDLENGTASHVDGGDRIEYRALFVD